MAAPQQTKTPVYKETSNIQRFNTNYHQHDARKEAGTALARALGVASNVAADQAKEQKAKDLEEGKRLALMGVARDNVNEAATGQGIFSGVGGWTMQGYDLQRGIEDAFIRQSELIEAFNSSGLSETDDIGAFQAFVDQQRETIFSEMGDVSDYYREGYMEGIAPAFQKMGRAFSGSAESFRTKKKVNALRSRAKAAGATGDLSEVNGLIDRSPTELGLSHQEAKEAVTAELEDGIRNGSITNVPDDVRKKLNSEQQDRLSAAEEEAEERQSREEQVANEAAELRKEELILATVRGDDPDARAQLRKEFPEAHDQLETRLLVDREVASNSNVRETQRNTYDFIMKAVDFEHDGPQIKREAVSLFLEGRLDQDQYKNILRHTESTQIFKNVTDQPGYSDVWEDALSIVPTQQHTGLKRILSQELVAAERRGDEITPLTFAELVDRAVRTRSLLMPNVLPEATPAEPERGQLAPDAPTPDSKPGGSQQTASPDAQEIMNKYN